MLCERTKLSIGFENEGPALHLDEKFERCSTYRSLTFENELLHGRSSETTGYPNAFTVQDLEFYLI